jgi:hypothetical protein
LSSVFSCTPCEPAYYRIRLAGRLPAAFREIHGDLTTACLDTEGGATVTEVSGLLADQTALHSVLGYLYDTNLTLLSVEQMAMPTEAESATQSTRRD